jgi:Holliday junction resolvase RusA-like endonuclease
MIRVKLNITPPTATAQQKGATIRNGFIHFYKKDKVKDAEDFLELLLKPHAPAEPISGPVYVQVRWCFPYRKSEPERVTRSGKEIPHTKRPDLDNLEKNLLDVLTRLKFWTDDSRVFSKSTAKFWGPEPYLAIAIKNADELYNLEN